ELNLPAKEQPGPYFLNIDGETFLRTFCITQGDLLFTRTDGLDVALKNMAATGDENVSFSQAEAWLNKQHTRYMYRGKTQGPLLDLKKEWEQARLRLQEVQTLVNDRIHAKEEWDRLEKEQTLKNRELAACQNRLKKAAGSDALKKLQQLKQLREQAPAKAPAIGQEELAELEQAFSVADAARKEYEATAEKTKRCQTQWELLGEALEHFGFHSMTAAQIEQLQKGSKGVKIVALTTAAVGIILAVTGVVLHRFLLIIGALLMAAAVILVFAEKGKKDRICRMNGAINVSQLLEKWTQYTQVQQQRIQQDLLRKEAAEQEAAARQRNTAAAAHLEQLKARCRILNTEELKTAQIQWGVYQQSLTRKDGLQEQLILGGKTEDELQQLAEGADLISETAEQVQQLISSIEEQLRKLQQQKDALNTHDLAALWAEQTALLSGISKKKKQIMQWEQELAAVQRALLWLKTANEEMNTHFAPTLCTRAGTYLRLLTDGKYETLTLDEKYEIQLVTKNGTHPLSAFSQGTRDAVYFAFRLAVGDLLSEVPLPMVLDDPFVNLDEERKNAAENLLEKAAKQNQILYFTCR
ncbi:MAG: hypothetical protein IJ333_06320, partial [Clostridia bacterium]|nr:hypothetical protein [Clostridia bacterium]